MAEIDLHHFKGFSRRFVGQSHESVRHDVCPECQDAESRLVFQWIDTADGSEIWHDGRIRCTNCDYRQTEELPANEIRTRVTIQL